MPVTSVTEGERLPASGLPVPVYDFTFTIPEVGGSFSGEVDKAGDPVAAAAAIIADTRNQVLGIAAL